MRPNSIRKGMTDKLGAVKSEITVLTVERTHNAALLLIRSGRRSKHAAASTTSEDGAGKAWQSAAAVFAAVSDPATAEIPAVVLTDPAAHRF